MGGVQTISIAASPVTLTSPAGFTPTPSAGPTQAQNAVLKLTGTITAPVTITLPLPGYYIIDTVGLSATSVSPPFFRAIGTGEIIGVPLGNVRHIYNDGTNVRYVNLQDVGTYLDLAQSAVPLWISGSTKPPFLLCDGSTFSNTTYPVLAAILGGTTLPDFRGRSSFYLNGSTSRLTSGGAGIDGTTIFAGGGNNGVTLAAAQVPSHNSTGANSITVSPAGSVGNVVPYNTGGWVGTSITSTGGALVFPAATGGVSQTATFSGSNNITVTYTNGAQTVVPATVPGVVGGVRLIRAG